MYVERLLLGDFHYYLPQNEIIIKNKGEKTNFSSRLRKYPHNIKLFDEK
jgi:hypothetical protein